MPAFFAHDRGTVVRVTAQNNAGGSAAVPFRISMAGADLTGPNTRAIVTQAAIIEAGNYQFQHTLNETIYAYVFGDRIGELKLSGMCFMTPCSGLGPGQLGPENSDGFQQIYSTYRLLRIARAGASVSLNFGTVDYQGFLVGMSLEIADAERNLGQWAFRFNTFPGHQQ